MASTQAMTRYEEAVPEVATRRSARLLGWSAIGLDLLALWLVLPPAMLRNPVPSVALALVAAGCGVTSARGGERKLGVWSVVGAAIAAGGAFGLVHVHTGSLQSVIVWSALIAATLANATPLIFAAMGGILSERSGVMNIGLEGMMLAGAFFGIWGANITGSWAIGIFAAAASGLLLAGLLAFLSIHIRANQIVTGFGINFLALGITGYVFTDKYGTQGTPPGISSIPNVTLPVLGHLSFFGDAIGHLNLMVWLAIALVCAMHFWLNRTALGLRLRAVGEHPEAASSAGVSVFAFRYGGVLMSGVLAALGGAFLSMGLVGAFNEDMSAGRGFIALAAMIFGGWRPFGAFAAALLFGLASALALRLPTSSPAASTLFQALPYVLTIIAMVGIVGRTRGPAAVGVPYRRPGG